MIVPIPVRELVEGARLGAAEIASATDKEREVGVKKVDVRSVCIELNPQVGDEEVLPALRARMERYGVTSRVFDAGTEPSDCNAVLSYTASRTWEKVWSAGDETRPYLDSAFLSLRRGGKILATGAYPGGGKEPGRKAATGVKISYAVDQLLSGNPSGTAQ
ncbi:hypothetical protein [Niveibacterium terrae]|uniref:hypothetical protein n=1 Tax=Niveibacterium terrae TaxID=3373598 RepID=UPI003A8F89CE